MKSTSMIMGAVAALAIAGVASAKLPDPSPEAKEKAALAKADAAHKDKIGAYQLCQSQDVAVKKYLASAVGKGKKGDAVPPCADPGKFVPPAPAVAAPSAAAPAPVAAAPAAPAAPAAKK